VQKYPAKNRNNCPPLKSKSILNQINKTLYELQIMITKNTLRDLILLNGEILKLSVNRRYLLSKTRFTVIKVSFTLLLMLALHRPALTRCAQSALTPLWKEPLCTYFVNHQKFYEFSGNQKPAVFESLI